MVNPIVIAMTMKIVPVQVNAGSSATRRIQARSTIP
jgi:hypothetical protein